MTLLSTIDTREDIFETITSKFGFNILDFSPIDLGYLNLKWKIKTEKGHFFVKQYNKTRYPELIIQGLETSLSHQSKLHSKGFLALNYTHIKKNMSYSLHPVSILC